MKKLFLGLLLLATALVARAAAGTPELVLDARTAGSLQERIDATVKGDYAAIESIVMRTGKLTSADCSFIRSSLTGLKRLVLEGQADFAESTVPKSAFMGSTSLEYIRAERTRNIGSKAFSMCESLQEADFPNVASVEVQAFAQAKGSSASRLTCVRLPKLKTMAPRTFYYCTNLKELYLAQPPRPQRPEGKEGLWFERVTEMVIHVPSRAVYDAFLAPENSGDIDWSAFNFTADNGDALPAIERAAAYDDAAYDHLRQGWLQSAFDRTDKDFSGNYYTGDFKLSLNFYTFNMNLNAWLGNSQSSPQLSTLDAIRWAADNGFDAVDITCYYIPGYSNTSMPTKPEKEILDYARQIRRLCAKLGVEISGTGLQNNFADPNPKRRETDVERIKFWIKVAAEMGAPVIRIFAGPPPADIYREGWEKIARERMVPHIREVARYAKEHYPQVRIGLQNHGGMLATANQVMQVLEWIDCDNVGIVNDTGFYRDFLSTDARQYDWYRDIALILPYTNNFQIKKKPAGAETDTAMDLERLLYDIRRSPYRGYLPVELLWVAKDEGYPGKLETPPYEETLRFIERLKQAIEKTKTPPDLSANQPRNTRPAEVPGISGSEVRLLEHATVASLAGTSLFPAGTRLRAVAASGLPRGEMEPLQTGDRLEVAGDGTPHDYRVVIMRYELTNLALNPGPERIKKSSFRGSAPITNAFDGNAASTSGNGYTVDAAQAATPGKETFWLAVDLGDEHAVDAFGIAWGTSVGQLRKRLKEGTYRVAYTNDPSRWAALSDASVAGKAGLADYAAPQGWTEVYAQDTGLLPDANGNKFFFRELDEPLTARYVMITGELAESTIEIYNFFVFSRELKEGAAPQKRYPTFDAAVIRPDSPGLVLAAGRPAVVRRGDRVPAYVIEAHEELTLTATLTAPDGSTCYTSAPLRIAKGATARLEPDVAARTAGSYCMHFVLTAGSEQLHDASYFTAVDEAPEHYTFDNPYPVLQFAGGKLHYTSDYRGNRLPDYSHAGYAGGGEALPNVPVKIILEPAADNASDDAERIQRAVDLIGRSTPDAAGFRGALLLKAGTYRISRPIELRHDGVVIRGEGDGHASIRPHEQPISPDNWYDYAQSEQPEKGITKLVATWYSDSYNKNTAFINISGGDAPADGEAVAITDLYVPVGSCRLHVADAARFRVGDNVRIHRAASAAWAQDLAMDRITEAPGLLSDNQWVAKGKLERAYAEVVQEHTVVAVDAANNQLTLGEPVVDPLDRKYGIPTVERFDPAKRVARAGVENMQFISRFSKAGTATNSAFGVAYKYYDDENHAQVGVRIGNAEDIWVRRLTTYHTDVAVAVSGGVRRVTVQDVNCLEPASGTGGERRYSFTNAGGSQVLLQRCYARYTRHGFIVMGNVMGPNVFFDCNTDFQFDANEPHLRWSTAGLYDNVRGRIYVQNRWNNGTAHGWAGANYTLYNCEGKFIISQNPLAANYLFGQRGERLPFVMDAVDPGQVPNFQAVEQSLGRRMEPASLYRQQLLERCGAQAVAAAETQALPAFRDESNGFLEKFAYLAGLTVDGTPIADFRRDVLTYEIPVALDCEQLPVVEAVAESGVRVERTPRGKSIIFTASKPQGETTTYTVRYNEVSKAPVSCNDGSSQVGNLTDGDARTSWSRSGSPYVQFYFGDTPAEIVSVSLGYCRNTQSRRQYYFDFEVSDDGYNWTKVKNPQWMPDNLGRGHVMGMQLMPGVGNNPDDYETFRFPTGVRGRLLRVRMYGARFGRGNGTTNANAYWAIDVETR